ncbi:MAG: RnfABCDGE type electron transport complex subunit G [Lentisphaeria bacterium]|nr:RnfABCDGE type electron transport complex subunit G [Lentisphaeria bacterium]
MKLRETENIVILGIFLALTGLISALVLAVVSGVAEGPIKAAELRNATAALKDVLPTFDNNPAQCKTEVNGITFYGAKKNGKLVGFAAEGSNKLGYAGNITAVIGFEPDGTIRSILITKQGETPGLGTKACERKHVKTIFNFWKPAPAGLAPNAFLDQFKGKKTGNYKVAKDGGKIDYITGATVTSRAITALTAEIQQTLLKNHSAISKEIENKGK